MQFADGLTNVLAQLGMGSDKAAHSFYTAQKMTPYQLDQMYGGSWVAAKAVNRPAEDAMRKWRKWQGDAPKVAALEALEAQLKLKSRVEKAVKLARLHGSSALYIGTNSRMLELPLSDSEQVRFINVLRCTEFGELGHDAHDLLASQEPEFFEVDGRKIHASRLIIFGDIHDPERMLEAAYETIRNSDAMFANLASMIFEAKLDVYKVPNLLDQPDDLLYKRLLLAQHGKSVVNGIVLDSEEEYEQKQLTFAGLKDVLFAAYQLVAGAVDIPASILLGMAVSGLNATGDNEVASYDDKVQLIQSDIQEALDPLDNILLRMAGAAGMDYLWEPLRSPTAKEAAEINEINSRTLGNLAQIDVMTDSAIMESAKQLLGEAIPALLDHEAQEFNPNVF